MGLVEPVQMNTYQSNAYRKDLSWLHFDDKPRVQQVKDQQSWISVLMTYPIIPSSKQEHQPKDGNSIPCMTDLQRYKANSREKIFIEWVNKTNKSSNCLGGSFSNRDNVRASIQFGRENEPQHLKRWFFCSRTDPSIFTSIAPVLLHQSNKTNWVFPALPQSTVSYRLDSSSEANSSCCHRSNAWSHLE